MSAATITSTPAPAVVPAVVELTASGGGSIALDGVVRPVRATDLDAARGQVRDYITTWAATNGRPVVMTSTDPTGTWTVTVHPDGAITADVPQPPEADEHAQHAETVENPSPARRSNTTDPLAAAGGTSTSHLVADPTDVRAQPPASPDDTSADPHDQPPLTRVEMRRRARSTSLLTEVTNEAPAARGWRGALNTLGLSLAPSRRERAERADVAAVSQHWAGPRTIAVVNGKGGAAKTPTTILLSAVLARHGGAGVLAWDNNPTRGTLGWRTLQGRHDATVVDLLPHTSRLLSPQAQAAEMAAYVHHQPADRYDVLRSRPEVLAGDKPSDAASFNAIHGVLAKYFRLIVIDSGNDESTPQWRAMIDSADAIVVPTITRPEHAESARLLLDELAGADAHSAHLAENALVVVSQGSRAEPNPDQLVATFQEITRTAVAIPYDPAMAGRPLTLDSLQPRTRSAWLHATAALCQALS